MDVARAGERGKGCRGVILTHPVPAKSDKSPFLSPQQKRRNQSLPACVHKAYMQAFLFGSHPAACFSAAAVQQLLYLCGGRSLPVRQPRRVAPLAPSAKGLHVKRALAAEREAEMRRWALASPAGWLVPPQRESSAAFRSWTAVGLRRQPAEGGRGQGARRGETRRRTAARRRLISWLIPSRC